MGPMETILISRVLGAKWIFLAGYGGKGTAEKSTTV